MSFQWPWALLGLVAVAALPAAYRVVERRRAGRRAELAALGFAPARMPRRRLVPALLLGALALLVVAAARPQASVAELRREGTVVLALDTSTSMRATDLQPTRMDAAREALRRFVAAQPATVKVGVVAFGDAGLVVQRPTASPEEVVAALDRLRPGGGTSLGQGIFASLQAIAGSKLALTESQLAGDIEDIDIGWFGSSAIVLLSDGENTSQLDPLALARLAGVAGVKIYTVGLGDPAGTTVEVDGFTAATRLDEQLLRSIADTTGGRYLGAPDNQALEEIYGSIDLALRITPVYTEVSALVVAVALLLLVLGAGRSILRTGRVV